MSYEIHITRTAERDMERAADYIEYDLKNPDAADALLDEAEQAIENLLPFPEQFPLVEDKLLASWGIRFTIIKNYLAFYIVDEGTRKITVVRFLYAKSNWISILKNGFPLI